MKSKYESMQLTAGPGINIFDMIVGIHPKIGHKYGHEALEYSLYKMGSSRSMVQLRTQFPQRFSCKIHHQGMLFDDTILLWTQHCILTIFHSPEMEKYFTSF